jgi:NADPH-dependent glutamate synthase beta subunit-like oxidoreductase
MNPAPLHIAIVGSGPSGCYLADALGRKLTNLRIDIFDRLPTPFGLIRGGVAPDHQGTKNIVRQFERTLTKESVRFLGNIEIGRDIAIDELRQAYHIVVIATGALVDRQLGIPGEDLAEVYGSGKFVGWYNGIPNVRELAPRLRGTSVAIVGNGNVALDIARLLAKTPEELRASDLCTHARDAFAGASIRDIWLIGRRGPLEASFTTAELAELGKLARLHPVVDASRLPQSVPTAIPDEQRKLAERNLEVLHDYATRSPSPEQTTRLHFIFNAAPVAIHGTENAETLELERTHIEQGKTRLSGERWKIPAQTIIVAIGYRSQEIPGLPFDPVRGTIAHEQGRVKPCIYSVGWCKRGPQGVIPANRADALAVADLILADLGAQETANKPGGAAIDTLLQQRRITVVDSAGWQRINATEIAAGTESGRPREKLSRINELLTIAQPPSGP